MIVLFQGGPYDGEFENFPEDQTEIRVRVWDGGITQAAFYQVGNKAEVKGKMLAIANYVGTRDSAESLIDIEGEDNDSGLTGLW